MAKDIPQLQELAGKVWKKEDELKQLKSELSALDRKIQLDLAPPAPVSEGQEQKINADVPKVEREIIRTPEKEFDKANMCIGGVIIPDKSTSTHKGFKI